MIGGGIGPSLVVAAVDEDGAAAGASAGLDVAPAVADHVAGRQVDRVGLGRLEQEAGVGLAPQAVVAVLVADQDGGDRHLGQEPVVHRLHHLAALGAAGDVGLIRGADEQEAGVTELPRRPDGAREDLELLQRRRGTGAAVADDGAVPARGRRAVLAHFTDSHFVARVLTRGCETSRCQTTAWNASECGVMWSGLTVGTMAQASATLAVKPPSLPTMPM